MHYLFSLFVSTYTEDGLPFLKVSDTGIGIPEEDKARIFERFYRVDKSHSRETGGTGLGLSIVKHSAMLCNAKINVKSKLGNGTQMEIEFPESNVAGAALTE